MMTRVTVFAALLFSSLALFAQQPSAAAAPAPATTPALAPAPGHITTLTEKAGFWSEPSVAANAANPAQVVAAYQEPASVAYSQDGGATWKTATGTAPKDYRVAGDVSITYDKKGHAVLCYIAFDKLGSENYWARGATRNGIFVRRSLDGGATWEADAHTVIAQPTKPGIPFEDKPYIVADDTDSKFAGNLYIGWTEFRLDESVLMFSRSTDGGVTWSAPTDISSHHGRPRDDNGAVEGFSGAVGADGTLYVVWADGDSIAFTSSRDGGRTFSKSKSVLQTAPMYFDMQGMDRANGFPVMAIDTHHGRKGLLYVAWSDLSRRRMELYCATSDNGGKSWSKAVRVSTNSMHDGTDQFFPWLAVDPVTGAANLIFYDRRADPDNQKTTITLARSTDGGHTFTNYAWTHDAFIPRRNIFMGDYLGIAALNNKVYGSWAEVASEAPAKEDNARRTFPSRTIVKVGVADFGSGTH